MTPAERRRWTQSDYLWQRNAGLSRFEAKQTVAFQSALETGRPAAHAGTDLLVMAAAGGQTFGSERLTLTIDPANGRLTCCGAGIDRVTDGQRDHFSFCPTGAAA